MLFSARRQNVLFNGDFGSLSSVVGDKRKVHFDTFSKVFIRTSSSSSLNEWMVQHLYKGMVTLSSRRLPCSPQRLGTARKGTRRCVRGTGLRAGATRGPAPAPRDVPARRSVRRSRTRPTRPARAVYGTYSEEKEKVYDMLLQEITQ